MSKWIQGIPLEKKAIIEEFYEEKHNFINKLIVLKDEIENGKTEKVIKSIDKLLNNCGQTEIMCDSGNSTIDAIINFKYAVAREYGIGFSIKIFVPEELPIEYCDIGVVLGNALDNAIEAVKECHVKEKVIDISIGIKKESLIMVIKNPYEHDMQKDGEGRIISSKRDNARHGYGLKSIMDIAAKYQGDVVIDVSENVFSLTVVMGFFETINLT